MATCRFYENALRVWFENYLCNRKQNVKYNGVQSEGRTNESGVSQGSVLRPLLFLLYIKVHLTPKFFLMNLERL